MSTSVCQGLQSCLEPGLVEQRVLKLKLAQPNSNPTRSSTLNGLPCVSNTESEQTPQTDENNNLKGWSFLQALSNTKNDIRTDKVYVHPMVKRSASILSANSLEMCTESLGSETGSEKGDSSHNEMSLLSVESEKSAATQGLNLRAPRRLLNRSPSFPPPLTTISSSSGLQVRSHREDGRLVLEAVIVSSARKVFHAERAEGRLKLRLMKSEAENEDEDEEEEEEVVEEDGVETEMEADGVYDEKEEESREKEEDETEEVLLSGDMEGNSGNVKDEMGNGKFQRPSKCKEDELGNRVLKNWEPFLVAT